MSASLVIQTSFLGDVVLTTPLLSQLARRGPVDVVTTPAAASLLANHPAVREVIAYDKRGVHHGIGGLMSMASTLRAANYEIAFLAQGSWRSAALALLARVPTRIGFATSAGRFLYTKRAPYQPELHHSARLLMLARPNGREPSVDELRPSLYPAEPERNAVDALLAQHDVGSTHRLIALSPGSVWGTKRWPYYPGLAALLSTEGRIVVVGGPDDASIAAEIIARVPSAIDATGKLSLLASAELIGRSAVIVTNDSAPMHLASAMGTPTVAIFGPTVPGFGFGPLAPKAIVVGHPALACRPCDKHGPQVCPLGHFRCMKELDPSTIAVQVQSFLQPDGTT